MPPSKLQIGDRAPGVALTDASGQARNYQEAGKTLVLVFYRGHW